MEIIAVRSWRRCLRLTANSYAQIASAPHYDPRVQWPTFGVDNSTKEVCNRANQSQRGGSGNFANDPQTASEAGKKGGQHSHQQGGSQTNQSSNTRGGQPEQADESGGTQQGGSGNFANDSERASEAGRKGGQHSHGGK